MPKAATKRSRLTVRFHRVLGPPPSAWWEAVRPTGGVVRGGWMPIGRGVVPHDLAHLAVEGALGIDEGFWGLLARGATYKRGTDRRATRPGRAVVAAHRHQLAEAEAVGNHHHVAWRGGEPTPVGPTFDRMAELWGSLPDGGVLVVEWPSMAVSVAVAQP